MNYIDEKNLTDCTCTVEHNTSVSVGDWFETIDKKGKFQVLQIKKFRKVFMIRWFGKQHLTAWNIADLKEQIQDGIIIRRHVKEVIFEE